MKVIHVVWKDSNTPKAYKPVKYRGQMVYGSPKGWEIDIEGDKNLYATHYDALNAIDKALGGRGQKGSAKRQSYGITIIGKKDDITNENTGHGV